MTDLIWIREGWQTLEVERALYVDRGRDNIACDRDIVGPGGGTLLVKLKAAPTSPAPDPVATSVRGELDELMGRAEKYLAYNAAESGADIIICELLDALRLASRPSPVRVEGATDIVDEAACLIWAELCPGMVMQDEDRPHYEAAAKAVLAAPPQAADSALREALEPFVKAARIIQNRPQDYGSKRVAAFGGLEDAHDLYPRHFLKLLEIAFTPASIPDAPEEGKVREVWHTMDKLPEVGRKFICLYNDGSGAVMFWRHDDGYIDQEGDDCRLEPSKYDRWAYLPDELEFWCETRAEDPMTLALSSSSEEPRRG
ncbi:hypothetical protein [Bradyrhizobium neotropicale]|uniref:hypothetical protein n=1 Tax=Bradyrhizobium neotropicale TaxID=1497615 RepID=UPI001AD7437F|nr:hypothetical protein [Bradyrhizobium neotropicale]MBO4228036.1 hypothetical protein [Bradyrhizobium neotropicale]